MVAGNIAQFMTVLADVDINLDGVSDGVFDLSGMTGIAFGNPIDTGVDGIKDRIDTELVQMRLVGVAPVGLTEVRLGASPSLGQVNQAPGSSVADSFFDVFIEVDTLSVFGGPLTLHNAAALPMRAEAPGIPGVPPYGAVYASQLASPLPLLDAAGREWARLISATLLPLYGLDFGNFQGSIDGQKFDDADANGARDPGERGLNGWTILLYDAIPDRLVVDPHLAGSTAGPSCCTTRWAFSWTRMSRTTWTWTATASSIR
jgi:hypothetical protein